MTTPTNVAPVAAPRATTAAASSAKPESSTPGNEQANPTAHTPALDALSPPLAAAPGRVGATDDAVLVVTADAPIDRDMLDRVRLSYLTLSDGTRLRCACWDHPQAQGTVLIMTGYSEFIEKYYEVITELYDRRYSVVCFDWRGQGLSTRAHPRRCGWVTDYDQLAHDVVALADQLDLAQRTGPLIGLGHSMGGHLAVKLAEEQTDLFDKIVVTAPMMGLVSPKTHLMRNLARVGNWLGLGERCLPGNGRVDPYGPHVPLSADPTRIDIWRGYQRAEPYLITHGATWRWALEAARSMIRVNQPAAATRVCTPMLIVNPLADTLVSPAATQRYAADCPATKLVDVPDAGHEILQEAPPLRNRFWVEFDQFVR